jgi:hypothetical protein
LAVAAVLTLTACDSAEPEPTPAGPDEAKQAAAADRFADCLTAASVPFRLVTTQDGQKDVYFDATNEVTVFSLGGADNSGGYWGGDYRSASAQEAAEAAAAEVLKRYDPYWAAMLSGASREELDALGSPDPEARFLVVGATDHTQAFVDCLDQSGYTPSTYKADPAENLKSEQRLAAATVKWAQCARDNGYPGVKDPPAPAAGDDIYPTAVLPAEITTAELKALLDRCPNYDVEAEEALREALEALGGNPPEGEWQRVWDEHRVDPPSIGFDVPGWDGTKPGGGPEPDPATLERLRELERVLSDRFTQLQQSIPAPNAT